MGGGVKLLSLAVAVVAMAAFARLAEAPQPEFTIRSYIPGLKKYFPDPTMGIRGENTVLQVPAKV